MKIKSKGSPTKLYFGPLNGASWQGTRHEYSNGIFIDCPKETYYTENGEIIDEGTFYVCQGWENPKLLGSAPTLVEAELLAEEKATFPFPSKEVRVIALPPPDLENYIELPGLFVRKEEIENWIKKDGFSMVNLCKNAGLAQKSIYVNGWNVARSISKFFQFCLKESPVIKESLN